MSSASKWSTVYPAADTDAAAITPSDTVPLARPTSAFFVGTGGAVAVVTAQGNAMTFSNIPSGTTVRLSIAQVMATGTTASGIVGLYP